MVMVMVRVMVRVRVRFGVRVRVRGENAFFNVITHRVLDFHRHSFSEICPIDAG